MTTDKIMFEGAFEKVLKNFSWDDYGYDDLSINIQDDPESQEWIVDLAKKLNSVVGKYMMGRGLPEDYV